MLSDMMCMKGKKEKNIYQDIFQNWYSRLQMSKIQKWKNILTWKKEKKVDEIVWDIWKWKESYIGGWRGVVYGFISYSSHVCFSLEQCSDNPTRVFQETHINKVLSVFCFYLRVFIVKCLFFFEMIYLASFSFWSCLLWAFIVFKFNFFFLSVHVSGDDLMGRGGGVGMGR